MRQSGQTAVTPAPARKTVGFNLRTFESLKVRNFRYYFASGLAQMACMNMQMVTSGWIAYKLSGSAAILGLTLLANAIPQITLAFLGGTLADRVSKKLVLTVGLLASALVTLWIALSSSLGIITWHYLVVSSFFQGAIMSLMMPSRQSIVTELVGRDKLMNAVGLNSAGMNVNQIGAPAIAGFTVAVAGIHGVYYLMTGLYVVAALILTPMQKTAAGRPASGHRPSILADVTRGFSYVRDNPDLRSIMILSLFTVMLSMPFVMLLPVFTEDILKVGPEKLGILMSVSGIGALVSSLVVASLGNKGRGGLFLSATLVTGISVLAFAWTSSYSVALAIMVVVGVGQGARMALSNTLVQSYTADAYLGRVMSLWMMQWGVTSLASFGVSIVAELLGVRLATGIIASVLIAVTLYYYLFSQRIRKLQ